ncbi:hypothetical protein EGR_07640 [Echinococcus granulosus]|uniref:Uncharacterized protein n=1 Tax=Echinococcus granulosus TaxID=6210 RepID=W6U903_ECHGR|nr:hypothetical protein EGR_07640 [Echinococcus granulosus]EUB57475.1 hypothetical protein EGR_07640 [Echinococcus granulosus]
MNPAQVRRISMALSRATAELSAARQISSVTGGGSSVLNLARRLTMGPIQFGDYGDMRELESGNGWIAGRFPHGVRRGLAWNDTGASSYAGIQGSATTSARRPIATSLPHISNRSSTPVPCLLTASGRTRRAELQRMFGRESENFSKARNFMDDSVLIASSSSSSTSSSLASGIDDVSSSITNLVHLTKSVLFPIQENILKWSSALPTEHSNIHCILLNPTNPSVTTPSTTSYQMSKSQLSLDVADNPTNRANKSKTAINGT